MLILVAVTVNYSIKSGLLGKAQDAKIVADEEQEREKIGSLYQEYLVEKETGKTGETTFADYMLDMCNEKNKIEEATVTKVNDNKIRVKFSEKKYILTSAGRIIIEKERVKISTITGIVLENTLAEDDFENKITIPNGFKVSSQSGANVTEGIVIEDSSGNQFVWVPVGTIYTNKSKTESKEIILGRYINFIKTQIDKDGKEIYVEGTDYVKDGTEIKVWNVNYVDYIEVTKFESTPNTHADDIEEFINSVIENGGYYIGRYEAGDSSATSPRTTAVDGTLVCKAEQEVYSWITETEAATKCKNMYNSSDFKSDLINSYAWDTAIVYIQEFSGETNYGNVNKSTILTTTGENNDEYCKINDMSGNIREWSTETSYYYKPEPAVNRGGYYLYYPKLPKANKPIGKSMTRIYDRTDYTSSVVGFRPIIYIQ